MSTITEGEKTITKKKRDIKRGKRRVLFIIDAAEFNCMISQRTVGVTGKKS